MLSTWRIWSQARNTYEATKALQVVFCDEQPAREYVLSIIHHTLDYMEEAKRMIMDDTTPATVVIELEKILTDIWWSEDQLSLECCQVVREWRDARRSQNADSGHAIAFP